MNIEDTDIDLEEWKEKQNVGIAVCSGGMDSTSMGLAMLEEEYSVVFCHINLGQKSEKKEAESVKRIVKWLYDENYDVSYYMVDVPWLGKLGGSSLTSKSLSIPKGMDSIEESFKIGGNLDNPGLWTPARNIVLLSVASALADRIHAKKITLGANQSETAYRDNTMDFLKTFEVMARFGTLIMPEVTAPLYNLDKAEILQWGIGHDFYDIYEHTWSCDDGKYRMCGECGCCNNRQLAFFILNNILGYENYPDNQNYNNTAYFSSIFLPEAIQRFVSGMWYGRYLDELRKV